MSLEKRIATDLKEAMKAKDEASKRGIRAIKNEISKFKTDGSGNELNEAAEIKMVQKLIKQRQDSLTIYEEQGREDLAVIEREEMEVFKRYLPKQLSEADLKTLISSIIEETGASSMKDMGRVMGMASKKVAGRADGKTISSMVKQMLMG
ncbi:MAG: GatB/YqeY domain-containing protein [Bacteroidota bacterium]